MAEPKTYATIGEKYEALTGGKPQPHSMVWLTNPDMNNLPAHRGNPVLVQVPVAQFASEKSPYKEQGYEIYKHTKPAPEPVEARTARDSTKSSKN